MSHTLSRVLLVTGAAASALTLVAAPASAAPRTKGTTTVAPSAITASVLEGLTGPAQLTSAGAVFGIVGRTGTSVIKHVGGLQLAELDPATPATSLTLSNFWIDTASGTVSAIVDDTTRATVFKVGAGGVLTFTDAASKAITGTGALTGAVAGTATVSPA
ncbi:MAG: hypothetical protein ACXVFU_16025 [Nocardioidaceae bacterium]